MPPPDAPSIRVLLADDYSVWRDGVRGLFESDPEIAVVAEAADGEAALRRLRDGGIDVAVLDMEMPRMTGLDVVRAARAEGILTPVLALTSYTDEVFVEGLLAEGVSGYLTKDKPGALIAEAIRAVAGGQTRWFVSPTKPEDPAAELSRRERQVLAELAKGQSNEAIGDTLFISEHTVRNHLTSLYGKLGVSSAREAVAWAWETGFVSREARE